VAKGYLIAHITVSDPAAYAEYVKAAGDALKAFGASALVDPNSAQIMEGSFKKRTAIFEFDSFDKAKAFWASDAYQRAKTFRIGAADGDFMLISGKS
jgi:uncharacterized protein (DUF1330 family)